MKEFTRTKPKEEVKSTVDELNKQLKAEKELRENDKIDLQMTIAEFIESML